MSRMSSVAVLPGERERAFGLGARQDGPEGEFLFGGTDGSIGTEGGDVPSIAGREGDRRVYSKVTTGIRKIASALMDPIGIEAFTPRNATSIGVISPIFYSEKASEAQRQIGRITPLSRWVTEGKNEIEAKGNFTISVGKATDILMGLLPTPVPVPIASADIETGSSLFLDDDKSYVDVEIDGDRVEFYVREKSSGRIFYNEEQMTDSLITPKLFTALLNVYAINK